MSDEDVSEPSPAQSSTADPDKALEDAVISTKPPTSWPLRVLGSFLRARELGLFGIVLSAFIALALTNSNFLTLGNLSATAAGMSSLLLVASGMSLALIGGGFDLSVGGVMALTSIVILILLNAGVPMVLALPGTLLIALSVGLLNGFLIGSLGINPLITTLGTLGMARGVALILSEGAIIAPESALPSWFTWVGTDNLLGIRATILLPILLVLAGDVLIRRLRVARYLFFMGGSLRAAQFAGLNVVRMKYGIYLVTAGLAALAGLLQVSRFSAGSAQFGDGIELQAIAAAVIGGASLAGGAGSLFGMFLAVTLLALVQDALVLFRVSIFWENFISGAILVFAVIATTWSESKGRVRGQ